MINALKLILLVTPFLVASMLISPQSVQASTITDIVNKAEVTLVSHQKNHQLKAPIATITVSQQSDPIRDYLSCGCSRCVKAALELQGKLPIGNNF